MNWQNEWTAICGRVKALVEIGERLDTYKQQHNNHLHQLSTTLAGQANLAKASLKQFYEKFRYVIPGEASQTLQNYFGIGNGYEFTHNDGVLPQITATNSLLFSLLLLITEVNYLLTNISEVIKRQSERAFLHLQQSIVAAEDIQERWQKAFDKDEPACEKLGAAHLLLHGIYAFKAHGKKARTDLVFPERPFNMDAVQRTADGLVLTEWKKVKTQTEASTKAEQAREQAALYDSGVLGGIELANYRYIVLVSEEELNRMDDIEENGVTYRHINIAVAPLSPSKQAVK